MLMKTNWFLKTDFINKNNDIFQYLNFKAVYMNISENECSASIFMRALVLLTVIIRLVGEVSRYEFVH